MANSYLDSHRLERILLTHSHGAASEAKIASPVHASASSVSCGERELRLVRFESGEEAVEVGAGDGGQVLVK